MGGLRLIAEEASRLARLLPSSIVEAVAMRLQQSGAPDAVALRARIVQSLPSANHRAIVVAFLDRWRAEASGVLPQAVAAALVTAVAAERDRRDDQSVELVWTGPDVGVVPLRRTEQVVLQVIDSASERLLVVSYAVFNIPRICEALVRAAARGVTSRVVIESPDPAVGKNAYSTLAALGPAVASQCSVFIWPHETRPKDSHGKSGILHVKCTVADGRWLFLSSANLTEYAFSRNMELGALATGGGMAGQVEAHFERMIQTGTLARVEACGGDRAG